MDFGISIPILNSKADNTYEHLINHPILKNHIDKWNVPFSNEKVLKEDLTRVHSKEYVERLYSDQLESEIINTFELIDSNGKYNRYDPKKATLPLTELFEWLLHKVSGTIQCCRVALERGFCFYMSGGMHHAHYDYGSGFCLVNDLIIALRKMQFENKIKTAWIIDVDAHKGDGSAELTHNDDSIITLSIHMKNGWPLDGDKFFDNGDLNPAFIESNIDIGIDEGEEHLYTSELKKGLEKLKSNYDKPDLILVVSGVDPYEKDELASTEKLKLTFEQMIERDKIVYEFVKKTDRPAAYVMAGGYGKNPSDIYKELLTSILLEYYE